MNTSVIRITIDGYDESQEDIFEAAIKAAQDITKQTGEEVQVIYDGDEIVETYMDFDEERQDYAVFTHFVRPRFINCMTRFEH